jgi:hypothetical protein
MASFLLLDALCAQSLEDEMWGNKKSLVPKCDSLEKHVKEKKMNMGKRLWI